MHFREKYRFHRVGSLEQPAGMRRNFLLMLGATLSLLSFLFSMACVDPHEIIPSGAVPLPSEDGEAPALPSDAHSTSRDRVTQRQDRSLPGSSRPSQGVLGGCRPSTFSTRPPFVWHSTPSGRRTAVFDPNLGFHAGATRVHVSANGLTVSASGQRTPATAIADIAFPRDRASYATFGYDAMELGEKGYCRENGAGVGAATEKYSYFTLGNLHLGEYELQSQWSLSFFTQSFPYFGAIGLVYGPGTAVGQLRAFSVGDEIGVLANVPEKWMAFFLNGVGLSCPGSPGFLGTYGIATDYDIHPAGMVRAPEENIAGSGSSFTARFSDFYVPELEGISVGGVYE